MPLPPSDALDPLLRRRVEMLLVPLRELVEEGDPTAIGLVEITRALREPYCTARELQAVAILALQSTPPSHPAAPRLYDLVRLLGESSA